MELLSGLYDGGAVLARAGGGWGAGVGDGLVSAKWLEGMTRQPEMKGELRTSMFISIGLIEALPIIAVVIAIVLVFVRG